MYPGFGDLEGISVLKNDARTLFLMILLAMENGTRGSQDSMLGSNFCPFHSIPVISNTLFS